MVSLRFKNALGRPMILCVEPWASNEIIPTGSTFTIHYPLPPDRPDASFIEWQDDRMVFWCEGSTYEVDLDGERIIT